MVLAEGSGSTKHIVVNGNIGVEEIGGKGIVDGLAVVVGGASGAVIKDFGDFGEIDLGG